MTQKQVAKIMGCTRQAIQQQERAILHKIRMALLPELKRLNPALHLVLTKPRLTSRANELPIKAWKAAEALRLNTTPHAVEMRLHRGKYPHLRIRRANGPKSRAVSVIFK